MVWTQLLAWFLCFVVMSVVPDNSTTVIKDIGLSTKGTKGLKVTTGCVYPTANIKLQWFIVKDGMSPVLYENATQNVQMNASFAECTSGDCGGDEVGKMSATLTLPEDKTGEDYFIQAVISSPDFPRNVVVTSDVTYKLKFSEGENSWLEDNKPSTGLIVFFALTGIVLVTATVIIILVCQRRQKDPETDYIVKK